LAVQHFIDQSFELGAHLHFADYERRPGRRYQS
jgi:hypothetical protein